MHPKTLFRVLLKFLGLYLLIKGLISFVPQLVQLATDYNETGRSVSLPKSYHIAQWTRIGLHLVAGLYLMLGGDWLVNIVIRT